MRVAPHRPLTVLLKEHVMQHPEHRLQREEREDDKSDDWMRLVEQGEGGERNLSRHPDADAHGGGEEEVGGYLEGEVERKGEVRGEADCDGAEGLVLLVAIYAGRWKGLMGGSWRGGIGEGRRRTKRRTIAIDASTPCATMALCPKMRSA